MKRQFAGRHGIIKPCAIFGESPGESIIINNLAYLLRTFPVMPIVGDGKYPLHPVHVKDMARLCVEAGLDERGDGEYDWDAVNPEKTTYLELLTTLRDAIGARTVFMTGMPRELAYQLTRPLNWWQQDILIDKTDIDLMTHHITCSHKEPLGTIKFSEWAKENDDQLGQEYLNSMQQYYKK